ncbi:uncharacterized protein LOC114974834 [Acropora millepora]|uniref:uncharacterized protein LOC114974834 n=1 Tax=Acropora millepora TaxID=45264 RepID=UPI0010FCB878|nr:uncharacterized protein LOC114974834 [Acropora millepora]
MDARLFFSKVITNLMLRLRFICHEHDINLLKTDCCRNYHHPDCLERWMSTLVASSDRCPMYRCFFLWFKQQHAEAQAADANFMIRIAGLCEEQLITRKVVLPVFVLIKG